VTAFLRIIPRLLPIVVLTAVIGAYTQIPEVARAEALPTPEASGATLFRDKGCAYCHGANTQGTPKGPSLLNVRKTMKAPQIASQIKNGGQKMPSFDDSLSSKEIDQLVAYLRAKHRPQPAPQPAQPAANPPAQN